MRKRRLNPREAFLLSAFAVSLTVGCTSTPGAKPSIWPTQRAGMETPANGAGVSTAIASTTQAVKGQFSSMGTAVSSAYGKAKTAITSPFAAAESTGETSTSPSTLAGGTLGPEVYVMTGQLNESKGDYAKALDSYSKALEAEPKNLSALLSTARLYDRQNEREKAISFYTKATEVSPGNAATYAEMGSVYAKAGNLNSAKEQLQKAVNLEPKNTGHRSTLAGIYLDMGNADKALEELTQVHEPAMANYQMAYLHFTRKNVPATQQYLSNALQIDPNLQPARDLLASIGGGQSIQNVAQQGNQWLNQAQGIMQQASAVTTNVQNLLPANVPAEPTSYPATTAVALPPPPTR